LLHLLQPIWLLASAGIVIPVAIHLWNIRQGKTLKIGSIEFIARTAQQHARSLRLTELFLLLLRCLLILLLALLLAKPYWQNTAKQKGWIVMQKKDASKAYNTYKPLVDSLVKAGYTFHLFEKGFAEANLTSIISTDDTAVTEQVSYWQLVKMIDGQLLPGMPVYLFTENTLNHFAGERPEINIALTWKTVAPKDSVHSFIANAYQTNKDSIAVVMGESKSSGTDYRLQMLGMDQPRQKNFVLNVTEGKMQVAYQNGTAVDVDTATLRVTIFADVFFDDARYVQSALQSIQQVTGRKIILKTLSKQQELSGKQDWLFWLSDQNVPSQINSAHVLFYPKGKAVAVQSWMQGNSSSIEEQTELYQRLPCDQKKGTVVWSDGFGVPLLVKETREDKVFYECYTHFNPSWNEMVWQASFPQVVYQLINKEPKQIIDSNDHRFVDAAQLELPVTATIKKTTVPDSVDTTATKRVLWSIIFILFFIERFFSFRIKKMKANA
jgi:hypothetical protein